MNQREDCFYLVVPSSSDFKEIHMAGGGRKHQESTLDNPDLGVRSVTCTHSSLQEVDVYPTSEESHLESVKKKIHG